MAEPFLGQLMQVGFNFAPRGWATCSAQTLNISQNAALFSLLGTTYGGNGTTTFQLPDLRSRSMVGAGQGPGLSNYALGQQGGFEQTTLLVGNMPQHSHTATFASTSTFSAVGAQPKATLLAPVAGAVLGHADDTSGQGSLPAIYCPAGTATPIPLGGLNVAGTVTVNPTGGNTPVAILNPYLAILQVIALQGVFPTRN